MRVVIAGGGTAGHITPSIAVANRLRSEGATVEFIGSPAGPEASLVPAAGFRFHGVRAIPFRREISLRSASVPFVALRSVGAARPIVRDASVVLGMGGYTSVAPVLAARSLRVPTVVHEQNAVPGLANRFLARTVTAVALTFASSRARLPASVRAAITGLPLRREVLSVATDRASLVEEARGTFGLQAGRTTVLVTGGSQGALHVDRTIAGAIPLLAGRTDLQMLVLTGAGKESVVTDAAEVEMDLIVRALPTLDRMELALAVADVAVARAGANTIHELAVCGIPAILVPYPHATDDHQLANATELRDAGAAQIVLDQELSAEDLARQDRDARRRRGPPLGDGDGSRPLGHAGCRRAGGRPRHVGGAIVSTSRYRPRPGSIPTLGVPSLEGVRSVHLIGIGGAGMRNLAKLLLARGVGVSGSDLKDSEGLHELAAAGAAVRVGHDPSALGRPDAVVISSAIDEGNPELAAARAAGFAVWARQQAIAAVAASHRSIAVAGTTGKTTTTSMIATILERAGLDPTYLIGGDLNESGSGAHAGEGDVFLFEADESDGSFLLADPAIGVVTNVEVDHIDFYPGGEEELRLAFAEFCVRSGQVVVCADDPGAREAVRLAGVRPIRYGTGPDADRRLTVTTAGSGRGPRIPPRRRGGGPALPPDRRRPQPPGRGRRRGGRRAGGCRPRRMRRMRSRHSPASIVASRSVVRARGALFFDDYAHVPTELAVTLAVARARRPGRVVAVFQPHRYSRTQALWRELGAALTAADLVVVTDVYGANQAPIPGVTGALVVDGVRAAAPDHDVVYAPHREDAIAFLAGRGPCGRPRDHARMRRHLDGGRRGARPDRGGRDGA